VLNLETETCGRKEKRRNQIISSLRDEIIQRSQRKIKVAIGSGNWGWVFA